MSSNQIDEKEAEKSFNVELNETNSQQKTTIDLNKIFHIDLSYNFDLLKDLLSTLIRNQKLKDDKILDLETKLLDFKLLLNESLKDPETVKKLQQSKTKISTLLLKDKEFPNTSCLNYVISPPPNHINIEPSPKNDPVVNQIIVSNKIYSYINQILLFFKFL